MSDINLHLQLDLNSWQAEALGELARTRGVAVETMAKTLLNERLVERIHCAFDDLLSGDPILPAEPLRRDDIRREDFMSPENIEQRLRRLFAD
jgi:hypothetical protein